MLALVGIGLSDEKDISFKGKELVDRANIIYLENYTSKLRVGKEKLEEFYGKKVLLAEREFVESNKLIEKAKNKKIVLLIIGDVFSATTHYVLYSECLKQGVEVVIVNNASVLNAIGVTGLQLYKFGKVTSIPFIEGDYNVDTPYEVLEQNLKIGAHTLFLLDLKPKEKKFLSVRDALRRLLDSEERKGKRIFNENTFCVGCARLGSSDALIISGSAKQLMKKDFGQAPFSLIVPGKLHFHEEEMLQNWTSS